MGNQNPPITTDGCDVLNLLRKKFLLPNASEVIYGSVTHNFIELQTLQSLCHALKGTGTQPGNIFCKLLTLFSQQAAVFN